MTQFQPLRVVAPKDEVRRCAKCGEAAVVLVFEWLHSFSGVSSGNSTRDYRCQGCGAKFSLYPKASSITFIVLGLVMGLAIFPLGFTLFGWLRLRRDSQNPIVPGAARPVMRFRDGPPARKCQGCGAPVQLTKVTRHKSRGVTTGTEYEFACAPCNKTFVIESVWGHAFSILSTSLVAGVGVAFLLAAHSPGWRFGGGLGALLIAGLLYAQTGVRIANRFRYPIID